VKAADSARKQHVIRVLEAHASVDRSVKEGPKPVIEKLASPAMNTNSCQ
jgi:hypothetical protein